MTEDKFKAGLNYYINENLYGNAETKDLWDVLGMFDENVPDVLYIDQIMDTWTNKAGYPVIISDGSNISQERFFLNATGKISTLFFICFCTFCKFKS